MAVISRPRGVGLTIFLALALLGSVWAQAGESAGMRDRGSPAWATQEVTFRVRDHLSAQTQAALLPRHDVAFSLTHRWLAHAPGTGGEAARQEFAQLRVSQRLDVAGQGPRPFSRLAPSPLWADLFLEARVEPISSLHLSTTAAYDPAAADVTRATTELTLQPTPRWMFSLGSDAMRAPTVDAVVAHHTVTTGYRSSHGHVCLQLVQTPEETRVGVLVDLAAFLHRTLGF
jgi:hypothetical protein